MRGIQAVESLIPGARSVASIVTGSQFELNIVSWRLAHGTALYHLR